MELDRLRDLLDYRNRQFKRYVTGREREVSKEVILVVQRSSIDEVAKKYGDWTVEQLAKQFPSASLNIVLVSRSASLRFVTVRELARRFSGQSIEQIAIKLSAETRLSEALVGLSQGTLTISQVASQYNYFTIRQLILISQTNTFMMRSTSIFIASLRQLQMFYGDVTLGWLARYYGNMTLSQLLLLNRALSTSRRLSIETERIREGAGNAPPAPCHSIHQCGN